MLLLHLVFLVVVAVNAQVPSQAPTIELTGVPTSAPSPQPRIDGREQGYLWAILIAIISGPSILAIFLECVGAFKPLRNVIHNKAYASFQRLYEGSACDWIDRETDLETSYSKYQVSSPTLLTDCLHFYSPAEFVFSASESSKKALLKTSFAK